VGEGQSHDSAGDTPVIDATAGGMWLALLTWRHYLQIVVIDPGIPGPNGMLVFGWIVDSVKSAFG
jgi:hypothetical protein